MKNRIMAHKKYSWPVKLYLIHSSLADLILGPRSAPFVY